MITAKEARERVENLKTERGEKERKIAEEKITEAIERAEYCCYLGIVISNPTKAHLEFMGYQVEIQDEQSGGPDTKVEW